jgi:hypothetical protein
MIGGLELRNNLAVVELALLGGDWRAQQEEGSYEAVMLIGA